jgi:hypothetical protein
VHAAVLSGATSDFSTKVASASVNSAGSRFSRTTPSTASREKGPTKTARRRKVNRSVSVNSL